MSVTGYTRGGADAANLRSSGQTRFYDDFTEKADATIASGASYVSTSGHTVHVTGQLAWQVVSGRGTHVRTDTASVQSTYLSVDLAELGLDEEATDKAGYLWVEYEVPSGADPLQVVELITPGGVFGPPDFTDASAHVSFDASAIRYDTLETLGGGSFTETVLARGQYKALTPGTYRASIAIDGEHAYITDPRGRRHPVEPSALIDSRTTSWVTLQLYNYFDGAKTIVKVKRWGAELQKRVTRGAYASPVSVARALNEMPGRLLGAMQTSGANVSTAITTSVSAKLFGVTAPVPASRRVLVEGYVWVDETVPTTNAATLLMLAVHPDGSSTFGKLTTILSGRTLANNTTDAPAFADRQGTMTSYTTGRPIPFALILDLDSSFVVGQALDFQIKLQAGAASQFSFVDSGSASGGGSTLRRSTVKVTELPSA